MTIQSRNIYQTGNAEIDRILNNLSQRLDIIEGLRPDLNAGYYRLDSDKIVDTDGLTAYQEIQDGVDISEYTITVTNGSINLSGSNLEIVDGDLEITNGIIKLTIGAGSGAIEVYDVNGDLIHKLS